MSCPQVPVILMRLGISILNISIFINTQHIYKNAMKEPRKEQSNTIVTTDHWIWVVHK